MTDLDSKETVELTGKELMETGWLVTLKKQPEAGLLMYKRI